MDYNDIHKGSSSVKIKYEINGQMLISNGLLVLVLSFTN